MAGAVLEYQHYRDKVDRAFGMITAVYLDNKVDPLVRERDLRELLKHVKDCLEIMVSGAVAD